MNSLYLRIYLTVVAVLLLFAFASGLLFQRQIDQERVRSESVLSERMEAWGDLIQRSLPGLDSPPAEQAAALKDWSQRLRIPLALDDTSGQRIAVSESFVRREAEAGARGFPVRLEDGRTLWVMRPGMRQRGGGQRTGQADGSVAATGVGGGSGGGGVGVGSSRVGPSSLPMPLPLPFVPPDWQRSVGLAVLLLILFLAVSAGAYPVVRRLTRRLEALKLGVERFGAGDLRQRVEVSGRDEVAAVATSFNQAAAKVEALVRSHQSLLANASHELRSPLARMKMAVSMLDDAPPGSGDAQRAEQRNKLKREIDTNVAELDALVEEVLLASRLDAATMTSAAPLDAGEKVDLLALAAEEAARVDATAGGVPLTVTGDERLLRRALRNLLENARRYGGGEVEVRVERTAGQAVVRVCDRGPGVPEPLRERIFEPFYRLPGHAEQAGGVGLGLSLVRQIAERHGGSVRCEAREGGGSCFVLSLPG
ncbi:MAG: histidine kinase [Methylibium sp. NZG]|nr:MAG: histidine kinase [Methylibium sp. NZG]